MPTYRDTIPPVCIFDQGPYTATPPSEFDGIAHTNKGRMIRVKDPENRQARIDKAFKRKAVWIYGLFALTLVYLIVHAITL